MSETDSPLESPIIIEKMDHRHHRYPCCIVWTPIPLLTWLFPIIGHVGIGNTSGVIRDFAGPYFVSEDNMAFGWPTKYWALDPYKAKGGPTSFDRCVSMASEEYMGRMHNLFCDNCHSHVAMALNLMHYDSSTSWNMVKVCCMIMIHGHYVSFAGLLKTWLPFVCIAGGITALICLL
ncbi:transmembrane protein 222 [Procambarus clarkii]|uniref:transmembrane protein 222 n=1 Tax=Procambarus clarkii TaxID=6728 RepID=UPI001E677205|nr:transmembrane protein 222-like [Procambarus clarkii]XP_045602030.1 transmembrane protein 222-like [Procambarus clarkii]XP_045602031.1 transmembrane protein 222-like [Procambarus clarkii]XP_045602032.1 transmembrane protein 222-like [Procambarus clarkii]XP_045602033.1 transmembrane protein 222-like [Procambarus clarkii]XP_045602035.1 transmembrane protein 222-like [Procambarus clarkii]